MNISLGEYYQKYPYIVTLRKYWLEYDQNNELPDYREILSSEQIDSLYKILKNNTILQDYISGEKWGETMIENNYITEFKERINKNDIQDSQDIQETEIRNIFFKLSENVKKNPKKYYIEQKKDLPLYKLFFSFANMGWVSDLSSTLQNDINIVVTPYFYDPQYKYNKSWKFQPSNDTPSNIALLVKKELNFLLMEQDTERFRKEEAGLDSSQQLKYLKSKMSGNPIQEISSYINHADISLYEQTGQIPIFNPKSFKPKIKNNFNPTIPYNRKLYGISSSNLLTLQVVEAISCNNNYNPRHNLTNDDILMKIREENNLLGKSSQQINLYNSPKDGYQIPNIDGQYTNILRLYNQVSLKRIYH